MLAANLLRPSRAQLSCSWSEFFAPSQEFCSDIRSSFAFMRSELREAFAEVRDLLALINLSFSVFRFLLLSSSMPTLPQSSRISRIMHAVTFPKFSALSRVGSFAIASMKALSLGGIPAVKAVSSQACSLFVVLRVPLVLVSS